MDEERNECCRRKSLMTHRTDRSTRNLERPACGEAVSVGRSRWIITLRQKMILLLATELVFQPLVVNLLKPTIYRGEKEPKTRTVDILSAVRSKTIKQQSSN